MDKKEYVLSLLKKLEPYWDKISDLIINIELWVCDENDIKYIINIIEKHIKTIKDKNIKQAFEKTMNLLKKLKEQEIIERQKEELEIEIILQKIQNL